MKVTDLELEGLKLIEPTVFGDERGFFVETYNAGRYEEAGIKERFVQDNHSRSVLNTLRGLHYQSAPGQAKLLRVTRGIIWDVAVDIRPESPTFGRWKSTVLSASRNRIFLIPVGFAHGFCVLSDSADLQYKASALYDASTERVIAFDDPELDIDWPVDSPILSGRDQHGESFADFRERACR